MDPSTLEYSQRIFDFTLEDDEFLQNFSKQIPKAWQEEHGLEGVLVEMAPPKGGPSEQEAERLLKETYDLVRNGRNTRMFDSNYKDVILVVGNSGSGKSTLVQFIAGDNSKLEAVKKGNSFVIVDENARISSKDSTEKSTTLYPELIVNESGELAFYDCPGFKDNRGSAYAMAASYFSKLVFEKVDNIKVHICVDHAVSTGSELGQAFVDSVKHVGEMIKNAFNFKDCFSMVATKVPRLYKTNEDGDEIPSTDDDLITEIGDYIKSDSIKLIQGQLKTVTDVNQKHVLQNALVVFQSLSKMEGGKYTRIGLFRKPQVAGLLSKSKPMQASRAGILSAIRDKTFFHAVTADDFAYTLDSSTELHIIKTAKSLNSNISKLMTSVGSGIRSEILRRMKESNDWITTDKLLRKFMELLQLLLVKLKALPKINMSFIKNLKHFLKVEGIVTPPENFRELETQVTYMEFLEHISGSSLGTVPSSTLDSALTIVTAACAWYKILLKVYDKLTEDSIQQNRTKYNVANLGNWGLADKPQGLRVSESTAKQFFKLLDVDILSIGSLHFSEVRMNELNSIIRLTLAEPPPPCVENGVLVAKGSFLRLSTIAEEYEKKKNEIKTLNIFASCAVVIDTDFTAPGCHMVIAAPKWKIAAEFAITLDGNPGEDQRGYADDSKGENPGEPGRLGGSGTAAGHFVGIADEVQNPKFLTITALGGKGGRGQHGGAGGNAAAGIDAIMPTDGEKRTPEGSHGREWLNMDRIDESGFGWWKTSVRFRIYGKRANNGPRGGDGGAGGYGGAKGRLLMTIFSGSSSNYPTLRSSDGQDGDGGVGGKGGNGAKHGDDIQCVSWVKKVGLVRSKGWTQEKREVNGHSSTGADGSKGGHTERRTKTTQDSETVIAPFLNEYKVFLISVAAKSALKRKSLQSLLTQIDTTEGLNSLYNTSAYLHELNTLESQFYAIYNLISTRPFYESLTTRVNAYAEQVTTRKMAIEELQNVGVTQKVRKLALSTIYAACLGKLCSLKLGTQSQSLIVDLRSVIKININRIQLLETMDKRKAIKEFQKTYRDDIQSKVGEANELVKTKVLPAIKKIMKDMDDNIDKLLKETTEKKDEAKSKFEKLTENEKKMKNAMVIKMAFNIIKIGAQLANFAGPIGTAVGGVVTGGVTIGEHFVVEPEGNEGDAILIPPGVTEGLKELGNLVAEVRTRNYETFEEQLKLVEKEIKGKPDLDDVQAKLEELKAKLKTQNEMHVAEGDEDGAQNKDANIAALKKTLVDTLKIRKIGLENEIENGKDKKQEILDVVTQVEKRMKVVEAGLNVYNKYKDQQAKLDKITNSLNASRQAVIELTAFERKIQTDLFPMVRRMRDNVKSVTASLSTKSQVALDLTKWGVQGTLRGVRNTLLKVMEGYKSQSDVAGFFDQLNEALGLLMNIYDRLQNYQDQQKLGDFIANITAPGGYSHLLRDTPFDSDVEALNMTIQSNLVMLDYGLTIHTFGQWVFPFARFYWEKFEFPPTFKPVQDQASLKSLVVTAKGHLDAAEEYITTYWATIKSHTKFFFDAKFMSHPKLGGPFFIWSQEEHGSSIKALLEGYAVNFFADVRKSSDFVKLRRAIKFQSAYIRFYLKGADSVKQEAFEDALEYFVVEMVHSGINYYEFLDEFYVIQGEPVTLTYSVLRDSKGEPVIQAEARTKIETGDLLLSPFTLWTIHLKGDKKEEGLKAIKPFINDVTLELTGRGKYIYDDKEELKSLDLRPQEYYQVDENQQTIEDEEVEVALLFSPSLEIEESL